MSDPEAKPPTGPADVSVEVNNGSAAPGPFATDPGPDKLKKQDTDPVRRMSSMNAVVLNEYVKRSHQSYSARGGAEEEGGLRRMFSVKEQAEEVMRDRLSRAAPHPDAGAQETIKRLEHAVTNTLENEVLADVQKEKRTLSMVVGGFLMFGAVIYGNLWKPLEHRHDIHTSHMSNHLPLSSPLYAVGPDHDLVIDVEMAPESLEALEIKMVVSKQNKCPWRRPEKGGHRRLGSADDGEEFVDTVALPGENFPASARRLAEQTGPSVFGSCPVHSDDPVYIHMYLMQGNTILKIPPGSGLDVNEDGSLKKSMKEDKQNELFLTVDLTDPAFKFDNSGDQLKVVIRTDNHEPHGVMCEVRPFGWFGRMRVYWGFIIFAFTFVGVLAEQFHRLYATFFGSFAALVMVGTLYDRPTFQTAASLIDWGTLALLYAMMANVHILATTGFFQWSAARVVIFANGDVKKLFYCLTMSTGILSMFLDNVTTVMLFGPVTISIAKEIGRNPVPFYLAETICATIGGTATLIGDPPNVVIGNKLGLGFVEMIFVNGPLVIVLLTTSSFLLSRRFPGEVEGKVEIDAEAIAEENPITDPEKFKVVGIVFLGIVVSLFTHPIHHKEAAWFMLIGMFVMCILLLTHTFNVASSAVEYDTLMFFAMLFVLVECLAELGVIRTIADGIVMAITTVPMDYQPLLAQMMILVVSCYGSAFLESLPYTACMCGILKDMQTRPELSHISIKGLSYALSVGACVGGIGSIMGSSANLVCMSICERYCDENTPKVEGYMFMKFGLPVLTVCAVIAAAYQYCFFILFADITLPLLGE